MKVNKICLIYFLFPIFIQMETLQTNINNYYEQWEHYCQPDKSQKCREQVDLFLKNIDQLQDSINEGKKKQKAKLFFLKGKILDLLPAYQKSAEQYLHKSIKLNPTNGDCWNTLAHVLFKKGDIDSSQQAITMALEHKGKNKVSLRYQSILLRSQGKNEEERRKNIQQSLKVIKGAVMLDMKDPATWYFLGNAYFSNFIANFKKFDQLENALKAYNQAQKYFNCHYPDLYVNRGNVEYHMEHYQASAKDFRTATQIDPTTGCQDSIKRIEARMQFTKINFQRAGELKKNKIQELISNIPNSINNHKESLEVTSLSKLKERDNPKKLLTAKIVGRITNTSDIPNTFLALDNQGTFFSLSIYNVHADKLNEKMQKDVLVSILHPELKQIDYEGFRYASIQVFEPNKLRIGDHWLTKEEFNPAEVKNQAFEK